MYFANCTTPDEVKKEYRRLAKENHPDLGGNTATMQAINAAYHAKLEALHGHTSKGSDGAEHVYYYNQELEQELMDKIAEFFSQNLDGVNLYLVGTWLWVDGDTRPHKDKLGKSGLKFNWHGERKMWYWRRWTGRRTRRNPGSFEDICDFYGVEELKFKRQPRQASGSLAG